MLPKEFVRVFGKIEKLCLADFAVHDIVFNQLPIALSNATHPRFRTAAIHAEQHITNRLLLAVKHRLETNALAGFRRIDIGEIAQRREYVE